jgi:hypothetical protein
VTGFLRDSSTNTDGKYTSIYLTVGPSDEVRIRLNYAVEMQKIDVHTKIVNERLFERSFHFVFNTAQAEVDFIVSLDGRVQPIEVKSGAAGRLKSLHQLLKESPSVNDAIVLSSAQFGEMPEQRLRFIPIYFAGAIGN